MSVTDDLDEIDYFEMSTLITNVPLKAIESFEAKETSLDQAYLEMASKTKLYKLFSNEENNFSQNSIRDNYNYVIRELLTTEETFLNLIQTLIEDFLKPLATVMTQEERRNTAIDIEAIYQLHATFLSKLFEACITSKVSTVKIMILSRYRYRGAFSKRFF